MRYLPVLVFIIALAVPGLAADKSGVDPQVISLPEGPGSIEGLGESFEPNLNTGTAAYAIQIAVCPGVNGFQPEISLSYDAGYGNGLLGLGWKLNQLFIQRQTDKGLPEYNQDDRFILAGAGELVPLENGFFRPKIEGSFVRCRKKNEQWRVWQKNGVQQFLGVNATSQVETGKGIFKWFIQRSQDPNGNAIEYDYFKDGGNCYLQAVRYGFTDQDSSRAVIFVYEDRPDPVMDYRSCSQISTAKRLQAIRVESEGDLVRRYELAYETVPQTRLSLLRHITQYGSDGESFLPPVSFEYSALDPDQAKTVSMDNPPQAALSSPEADLVDINGDSLPDVLYTPVDGHTFYLNKGHGSFAAEAMQAAVSPSQHLATDGVLMGDLDANGQADLVIQTQQDFGYFQSSGRPWEQEADWIAYDLAPPFSLENPDTRLLDVNHDGLMDVIFSRSTDFAIYFNAEDNPWTGSASTPNPGLSFSSPEVHFADMSGDGMQDLVVLDAWGDSYYLPNQGFGHFAEEIFLGNSPNLSLSKIQDGTVFLMDSNADGLADLIRVDSEETSLWFNQGNNTFSAPQIITQTPAFQLGPPALRQADMNGDGCRDLLYSFANAPLTKRYQYLAFANGTQPNLMTKIDNGLGRVIRIEYKSSTDDYLAAESAGEPWATRLPFPIQTVARRRIQDKNSGQEYITDYQYRDGYYDGKEREFRGFGSVEQIEYGGPGCPTLITQHRFDVGDQEESRKGMLLQQASLQTNGTLEPPEGLFQVTDYAVSTRTLAKGTDGQDVRFSFTTQEETRVYEKTNQPKQLRTVYDVDDYGNEIQNFQYGLIQGDDLAVGQDEVLTTTSYAYQLDAEHWMLDRPERITQTDLDGGFVSDTRNTYDARGNLIQQEKAPQAGTWITVLQNEYDAYGNIVKIIDANNHSRSIGYDPVLHTFPVSETLDQLGLSMSAAYDPGFGKVTSFTDFNGHQTEFGYDVFGRLSRIIKPGDSQALPTQIFEYYLADPVSHVLTRSQEEFGRSGTYDTLTYYDGLGRKLQTRSEGEDGLWIVGEAATHNLRGLEEAKWLPCYAESSAYASPDPDKAKISLSYDASGRIIQETQPDGSQARTQYKPLQEVKWDQEDTRTGGLHEHTPHTFLYDGLERLVEVQEQNAGTTYSTSYGYDGLGNLVRIEDDQGHVKTMRFDGMGRKTRMLDPDKGEMHYWYDDAGNLIQTEDAKDQVITYSYDPANRILTEQYAGTEVRYHYDDDLPVGLEAPLQNTLGRLVSVEDEAGRIAFSYDARGNMAHKVRETNGSSFLIAMEYDALDRFKRLIYPDGTTVDHVYNAMNQLESIPGFVEQIDYHPSGLKTRFVYSNGVSSFYDYDLRHRLIHLQTQGWDTLQDLSYAYDQVSNITGITDKRQEPTPESRTRSFAYDDLYRLTRCSAPSWQINYSYDSIGNLIEKTSNVSDPKVNLGTLLYGQGTAGPHAVTQAGQDWTYTYDANGNLESKNERSFSFDPKDRLTSMNKPDDSLSAAYTYDYQGNRVIKTVQDGENVQQTLYIERLAEVRDDRFIKHVFAGDRRVASIDRPFEPQALIQEPVFLTFEDFDQNQDGQITLVEIRSQGDDPVECEIFEVRDALGIFQQVLGLEEERLSFGVMASAVKEFGMSGGEENIQTYFYIPDHLGSAQIMTDEKGRVVEESFFYPYGMNRKRVGDFEADYTFTGKELDDESELHYFGARYYDAMVGRFVSVDPLYVALEFGEKSEKNRKNFKNMIQTDKLKFKEHLNVYSYCLNNSIRYIDKKGKKLFNINYNFDAIKPILNAAEKIVTKLLEQIPLTFSKMNKNVSPSASSVASSTTIDLIKVGNEIVKSQNISRKSGAFSNNIETCIFTEGNGATIDQIYKDVSIKHGFMGSESNIKQKIRNEAENQGYKIRYNNEDEEIIIKK